MSRPGDTAFGDFRARLELDTALGAFVGAQRIALLEAIAREGSIARAARQVGLSYKAAWAAVDDMNNLSAAPLLLRASGGSRGGGSTLTEQGRRLITFYRALEAAHQRTLERARDALAATEGAPPDEAEALRRLLRRLAVQTSARNHFVGTVTAVRADAIEAQVELELEPGLGLVAVVTAESIERLGLRPGVEAQALVKSSSVMLAAGVDPALSARNCYRGTVLQIRRGAVNAELVLQLGRQHLQLAAVITDDSVQRLHLAVGSVATAFFKASSVVLLAAP